ncbi:hypothetical protein DFH07DRAFT_849671 [Mycena maculata]|uniref:Uncharacterized protein n=1 Tax=Mycena maculata TaxID=230809 RepID=A0AAD7HW65_9AGAR|nr:hypothetical protein DFH07DRAFT_849671 [Mycena maculata]
MASWKQEDSDPHLVLNLQPNSTAVAKPDYVVRPKFKHLIDPAYIPFPFVDLPVELALCILSYATGCSRATYRSLLLANRKINDLIRLEMLPSVSIILTTERQLEAFKYYLEKRPDVVPHIHALWTIGPGSVYRITSVCASIINTCTNIRALACHPQVLEATMGRYQYHGNRDQTFRHTRCTDLTLIEFRTNWLRFMQFPCIAKLLHQIERLHLIGVLDAFAFHVDRFPKLDNLARASIAMGSHRHILPSVFSAMVTSPKLKQVVITTRLHGDEQQALSDTVQEMDDRFSVLHRRRRWKEANLWHESLQDPVPRPAAKA